MDIIKDPQLILDLPLYKLDGGSFMSKDAYGYICTNYGATWGIQGRYFDGTNDFLQCVVANFGGSLGTIVFWIKTTDTGGVIISSADDGVANSYFYIGLEASGYVSVYQMNGDTQDANHGDVAVNDGAWHHCVVLSTGTAYGIYTDGVANAVINTSGADNGDWFADSANRDNLELGRLGRSVPFFGWIGTIGEVMIYNRVLTLAERQHLYLATKWRFSG